MIDILDTSPPGVNFQHIGLHQIDEPAKVMDDDGFFGFAIFLLNVSDFHRVRQPRKRMFLKEAVAALTVRASNERKRPARDMGEDIICDLGVIFREPELRKPLALPEDAVGMGQPDARKLDVSARCRLAVSARFPLRRCFPLGRGAVGPGLLAWHFELHLRSGLVLAQALERGLTQSLVVRPAAKLDFRDELRFNEYEAAPFVRGQRVCEWRPRKRKGCSAL